MPRIKESKPKAGRRGNNEGSIYQRKDGRWCGSVTIGRKTDGSLLRKDIYGKTRNEVAQKVAAMTDEVFKNGYATTSSRVDTNFETLFREWYELHMALNITDVTDEKFRSMMKKHIFPAFGMLDVRDVDHKRLQRFFNQMKTAKVKNRIGYSSDFIGKTRNLINNFFKYVVKSNIAVSNPMEDVVIRKAATNDDAFGENKSQALRPEVRVKIFEWVENNPLVRPLLITSIYTGLRPQETITLRWSSVNFDLRTLCVKDALKRVVGFDEDWNVISRGVKVGATKTKKSVRT